jgi:hypothetical protein
MSRKGQSTGMPKKRYSVEANPDICVVLNPYLCKVFVFSVTGLNSGVALVSWYSALACCEAGQRSNLGSALQGGFPYEQQAMMKRREASANRDG